MEAGCVVAAVIENAASGPRGEPGSSDVLEGDVLLFTDLDKDDALPQETNSNPPLEIQPEETSTAMVRSDVAEHSADPLLRSCVSTASMKVKNMKKLTFPRGHFPRLAECAHFHYETVDFGSVQLAFVEGQNDGLKAGLDSKELVFLVQITCQGRNWLVKRSYEDFRVLDKHLHLCIYDRRFSQLTELPRHDLIKDNVESVTTMLATYLSRFSAIADNKINCGPVLTWMEIDNKGNHLLVSEEASINVPAIAAAHVTKRYTAQATDELTFEVGDIVSVIDMPPREDTGWWRGKHGFQVGFFPCDCVELINDKIPPSVQSAVPKPVCKKHGKLVTFLRSFMKSRPPPQRLRQRGILRERVFGCDLGEHLHNSGHEVPQVVKSCADFIEKHGVVDGIYRLSGISSNIQKLRHEFDSEQIPDLSREVFRQDIHSVGSLCKLYFRELPNPLLTYQLYDRFSEAVSAATDEERLVKIHNVIQQLPPPHYRTLEFLMRHLSHLATFSSTTNMHTKNLAIVWAPNLLRSRQIESACFSGTAAFMEVRIQSVVVEFILNNTEELFSPKLNAIIRESTGTSTLSRPKSLLVCSPSTKLLSLEEAQARTQAQLGSPATTPCLTHSDYIEVGEGPGALLGKFHTVIELPMESCKRPPAKAKKSPVGNWLSFFHLGKSHSVSKRKLKRHPSEPNEIKSIALPGGRGASGTLRSTKSEESLTSLHNIEGEPPSYQRLRPRSTSEAVSGLSRDGLHGGRARPGRRSPPLGESRAGAERVRVAAFVSNPHQEDDLDLCPPAAGISTLDFDPMSFQCSPASATPGPPRGTDGGRRRRSAGCSSESEPVNDNVSSRSPDTSPAPGRGGTKLVSPKLRKKSFKTQADVPGASASSSPPVDGKEPRTHFQHCSPLSTASQASALTELSQPAQNLPDPGTDRLMSSVSVLPPHPPLTSAARKLALALAESAQKAAGGAQRRPHGPPPPLQGPEAPRGQDRPPRPTVLDLGASQEAFEPDASALSQWRGPAHFLPPHLDGQEGACNFTPNVSPLGSGSLDDGSAERRGGRGERPRRDGAGGEPTYQSIGVSTPTPPVGAARSPSASPVYMNADSINVFNFRAVLAETSVPASVEEVLPRPARRHCPEVAVEDVCSRRRHQHRPTHTHHCPRADALLQHPSGPRSLYRQSSETRRSTLGLRHPLSPQYRRYHRDEQPVGSCHRKQGPRPEARGAGHPAIRRARSFHAPHFSHYELAEAEVPPPGAMFYMEQAPSEAPHRPLLQFPVRFESCYSPYSDAGAADGARCYVEPPRRAAGGVRHSQSYTVHSSGGQADYCNYSPPVNRELYIQSRDTVVYEARDAGVFERVVYQPIRQDRRQNACPVVSPYAGAASPTDRDTLGRDIMHIRSKSDPGNACLLSADGTESQGSAAAAASPPSLRPRLEPGDVRQQGGASRRIQIRDSSPQQPPLRKVPSLPERGCPDFKSAERNDRGLARGLDPGRAMAASAVNSLCGAARPSILRRPGRSQSTRENRHYYRYDTKSPAEPEHLGSFSTQPNRRTQSTKVRPTQYDHMERYYAAPRLKSARSAKAATGNLPGQGCVSPSGHRLLAEALGRQAFYHAALTSETGVYE
ncbi:rho GTPase-activating protein 32 isoform X2 [Betta splendens]|uniref:Rho GTPase-activating protein 32 isoform X2 n=1 Tax=Betta splendens TaxID=158456 RepID=A0A6P7P7Z7_BETSP|nr:rho GTPase-activating protein 32 isoform X2 [Betta splendens]